MSEEKSSSVTSQQGMSQCGRSQHVTSRCGGFAQMSRRRLLTLAGSLGAGTVVWLSNQISSIALADDWLTHRSRGHRAVRLRGVPTADYHSRKRTVSFFASTQQATERATVKTIEQKIEASHRRADQQFAATRLSNAETIQPSGIVSLLPNTASLPRPAAVATLTPSASTELPAAAMVPADRKEFLLATASFGQAPFSVGGFTLRIDEKMNWSVSLRAEYVATDSSNRPIAELTNLRHQFQVAVRLYANPPSAFAPTQPSAGTASLASQFTNVGHIAEIALEPFWVERDQPLRIEFRGTGGPEHREIFSLARFAEVEFFVYLDAFSGRTTKTIQGRTLR